MDERVNFLVLKTTEGPFWRSVKAGVHESFVAPVLIVGLRFKPLSAFSYTHIYETQILFAVVFLNKAA